MGDATVGILVIVCLAVVYVLLIVISRVMHRRTVSRADTAEVARTQRPHDDRRRDMMSRAQHSQGPGHGTGGVM